VGVTEKLAQEQVGEITVKIRNQLGSSQGVALTAAGPAVAPSEITRKPARRGQNSRAGSEEAQKPSVKWQVLIFMTLILSVIASRFIDYYRAAVSWSLVKDWQYLLFAAIVSLLAFPIVYRKAQHSRHDPVLVQLGVIFAAGLGWEKVLSTAADLVKPIAVR